ncbi:MAG: VCBS repeat-containing protein [Ginsengibacter sp.]
MKNIMELRGNSLALVKIILLLIVAGMFSCHKKKTGVALFQALKNSYTGLDFNNKLSYDKDFNLYKYMYFYNGSGIGAGDFNNDGLIDLFFSSNQQQNTLYLNQGKLKFKDVTKEAEIPEDKAWSTGVSVIDINNDGLLDIYVCRVGNYLTLKSKNQLLVCKGINKNGIPFYKDEAHEYGLDFSGFCTQVVFFDYDLDNDLDVFMLNHSVNQIGVLLPRKDFAGSYHPLTGDRIYRNNGNNTFTDVTRQTGINSSAISYGLGIAVADINLDGYPDIYVTNDFHENDYLYINQKDGAFKEDGEKSFMHTSKYSMGVDVADINNDAYPEIISMDMLPADPYILKTSMGEDDYDIFYNKIARGYSYQYTRNNLQLNRRNGLFSEIGLNSGVAATDWSWAPLWVDFDNDGYKDLFISNGISKRMNDIDYINFVSNGVQQQTRSNFGEKDLSLINKFPEIKLPNNFFKNNGNILFSDLEKSIDNNLPTFSNGAIYADLDNDGDMDIVVNNINAPALLYENKTAKPGINSSVKIKLKGLPQNINAIGSKIIVYANNEIRSYEKYPVRGFMSSMEIPLCIGLTNTKIDSAFLLWPDNTFQPLSFTGQSSITISYQKNLALFNFKTLTGYYKNSTKQMVDITKDVNLNYLHEENHFNEFDRESLIPHMVSTEGPALAVADVNHDGLEDVFIGSSRYKKSVIFLQQSSGKFIKDTQPALDNDSLYEDVDACFADVNNDGNTDLIVVSGGNELYINDEHNSPRIYLNDGTARLNGHANFTRSDKAFRNIHLTASSVAPYDFNGDGYIDLFIGARTLPDKYGQAPQSYLLQNDRTGKFKDVTKKYSNELSDVGFVTRALWFDIDKDGDKDLLISLEWGGIIGFINNKGTFTKKILSDKNGWWNFILPCDIDNDGDIDLIAGNLGLNSRLKASDKQPVKLYYNDFDDNGKKEQVLTYFLKDREIPFAGKSDLEKQLPNLKKKFLYAKDFAKATLSELFTSEKLESAQVSKADYFSNSLLVNQGGLNFQTISLPSEAQFSPYKDAVIVNANSDSLPDILLVGNYYDNNVELGRYDADYGTILINKGKGKFICETINGLSIKGQVRYIKPIKIANRQAFILVRNNDSALVIKFSDSRK